MANDEKISQLTNGDPAQGGDELVVDRSGSNFRVSAASIADLAAPSLAAVIRNYKYWVSTGRNSVQSGGTLGWVITNFANDDNGAPATATNPAGNELKTQGSVDNTPATVYDSTSPAVTSVGTLGTALFSAAFSTVTNNTRWIGFSDAELGTPGTAMNSDTPAANVIGFMWSSTIGSGNWQAVCQTDASHQTLVDTGIPASSTSRHLFKMVKTGGAVVFSIDGTQVATVNTNVPAAATLLKQFMYLMNHVITQQSLFAYFMYSDVA